MKSESANTGEVAACLLVPASKSGGRKITSSRQASEVLGRGVAERKIRISQVLSLLVITAYHFISILNIIEKIFLKIFFFVPVSSLGFHCCHKPP